MKGNRGVTFAAWAMLILIFHAVHGEEEKGENGNAIKCVVQGIELNVAHVYYGDNVLNLRTRDSELFGPGVGIRFSLVKGVIPEGKTLQRKMKSNSQSESVSSVSLSWPTKENYREDSKYLIEDFDALITFGKLEGDLLPGTVRLVIPEMTTEVTGKFTAKVTGLRLKDGLPDLTSDGFEVINHACRLYLENSTGRGITIQGTSERTYQPKRTENEVPQGGHVCIQYLPEGEMTPKLARLVLEKRGTWGVSRTLRMDQLFEVHAPLDHHHREHPWAKLEEELQRRFPGKMLFIRRTKFEYFGGEDRKQPIWMIWWQVEGEKKESAADDEPSDPNPFESLGSVPKLPFQESLKTFKETWLLDRTEDQEQYRFVSVLETSEQIRAEAGTTSK